MRNYFPFLESLKQDSFFKLSLKYGLLHSLLTSLLFILLDNGLNISYQDGLSNFENLYLIISPIYNGLVFIIVLNSATKVLIKSKKSTLLGLISQTALIILFSSFCSYILILISRYVSHVFSPYELSQIGYFEPFKTLGLYPLNELVIYPFFELKHSFLTNDFESFISTLFQSKVLVSLLVLSFQCRYFFFIKLKLNKFDSLIPFKNKWVLLQYLELSHWFMIPICIPLVRLVPLFYVNSIIAKKMNKETSFTFSMILFPSVFYGKIGLDEAIVTSKM
jgi:hypothetical protein